MPLEMNPIFLTMLTGILYPVIRILMISSFLIVM